MKIVIVGFNKPGHMGFYLATAARQLKLQYRIIDMIDADASSRILRSIAWHFCDKRPTHLSRFANQVWNVCTELQPDAVLTTGCAPLYREDIEKLRALDAKVINYSTDDPWNPALRSSWFLNALPAYDAIYTPRHANHDDFIRCGVRRVRYLPFAYDPEKFIDLCWGDSLN